MKTVAIIPARLESTRLRRKALVDICGLPMVIHVYRRSLLAKKLDDVYIATDSEQILDIIKKYGAKGILTHETHQTGTDRIAEAAKHIDCDIVVNVQGDEALVNPDHIDRVVTAIQKDKSVNVAVLVAPFTKYNSPSDIKAVLNENGNILYISRSDIPSSARTPKAPMLKVCHIVPFRREFLFNYAKWERSKLEIIEFNEYLRILEKGYAICAVHVDYASVSVDTEEDLALVRKQMESDPLFQQYKKTESLV